MFYSISLYIALAIFIGGLIYKIAAWLFSYHRRRGKRDTRIKKVLISGKRNTCHHIQCQHPDPAQDSCS